MKDIAIEKETVTILILVETPLQHYYEQRFTLKIKVTILILVETPLQLKNHRL